MMIRRTVFTVLIGCLLLIGCRGGPDGEVDHLHEDGLERALASAFPSSEAQVRYVEIMRRRVIETVDVSPGMAVAELGAGTGTIAFHFAEAVGPEGIVYATDIDPVAVENLKAVAAKTSVDNVVPILVRHRRDTGLDQVPDESLTAVLMINSVSFKIRDDPEDNRVYIAELLKKTRAGGLLIHHSDWLNTEVLGREAMIELFRAAGFAGEVSDIPLMEGLPARAHRVYENEPGVYSKGEIRRGFALVFRKGSDAPFEGSHPEGE